MPKIYIQNLNVKNMEIKSCKVAYECPIFKVEERQVVTHSGAKRTFWVVIRAPHVATIALTKDKKIVLTKEHIGRDDKQIITIPGGKVEVYDADIAEIKKQALAELQEESGYEAKEVTLLSQETPPLNWYERTFYKFVAWDVEQVGQNLSGGESIIPFVVSVEEAKRIAKSEEMEFIHERQAVLKALAYFEENNLL